MDVYHFIKAVLAQDEATIRSYFHEDAYVNWHCTNEHFTVDEYIVANCEYPGDWDGEIERLEALGDLYIAAVKVYLKDKSAFFHVVSFIKTQQGKIISMDEYWADDGASPQWRQDKHIGTAIHTELEGAILWTTDVFFAGLYRGFLTKRNCIAEIQRKFCARIATHNTKTFPLWKEPRPL